jgi:hypothetical protein
MITPIPTKNVMREHLAKIAPVRRVPSCPSINPATAGLIDALDWLRSIAPRVEVLGSSRAAHLHGAAEASMAKLYEHRGGGGRQLRLQLVVRSTDEMLQELSERLHELNLRIAARCVYALRREIGGRS